MKRESAAPLLLRPLAAWRYSGYPRKQLYDALHTGELRAMRTGGGYLIHKRDLEAFIEEKMGEQK